MNNPPPLSTSIAYRMYRLQRLLRRQFLSIADEAGHALTPEQFFLLDKLRRQDGQTQTELADEVLQDRANLTRMIGDFEKRGLMARRPDPHDGRKKRVHLTASGLGLYNQFFSDVVVPARGDLFDGLEARDLEAAHRVFDHLESKLS